MSFISGWKNKIKIHLNGFQLHKLTHQIFYQSANNADYRYNKN